MPGTILHGRPLAEVKADLFRALAHPARIRVLEVLVEGEHSVERPAAARRHRVVAPVAAAGRAPTRGPRHDPQGRLAGAVRHPRPRDDRAAGVRSTAAHQLTVGIAGPARRSAGRTASVSRPRPRPSPTTGSTASRLGLVADGGCAARAGPGHLPAARAGLRRGAQRVARGRPGRPHGGRRRAAPGPGVRHHHGPRGGGRPHHGHRRGARGGHPRWFGRPGVRTDRVR